MDEKDNVVDVQRIWNANEMIDSVQLVGWCPDNLSVDIDSSSLADSVFKNWWKCCC